MSQVKCSKCSHINPTGTSHCQKCGSPLLIVKIDPASSDSKKRQSSSHEFNTPGLQQGTLHRGETFSNRYTVIKLIGRGGMGSIYKVFDNTLKEEVALKLLLPQFAKDPMIVDRFLNEARIARKLSHPNIVRVHDIGIAGNILYISMEYLDGKSLRGILEGLLPGQRLPLKQILVYFDQLCSALEYAHQFTVHRDIKPENVMVTSQNVVKLMDFGISKLMADTRLTGVSVVMGTPFYMSPEQVRNSRDVDARSDIYSCGIMLYEVLTGQIPTGIPKPASELVKELPPELDKIVEKCIQPDPKDRFQSATELRKALEPLKNLVLAGEETTISSSSSKPTKKLKPWIPTFSSRAIGWILLSIVLLFCAGGLFFAERYRASISAQEVETISDQLLLNEPQQQSVESYIKILFRLANRAGEQAEFNDEVKQYLNWAEPLLTQIKTKMDTKQNIPLELLCSCARYLSAIFCEHQGMVLIPEGNVTWKGQTYIIPAFFMDISEVTNDDFNNFCRLSSISWEPPPSPGFDIQASNEGKLPVTMVTYYDALAYASYYQKTLPTVLQWLRSAQGDIKQTYPWGDTWKENSANINNIKNAPQPVKSYPEDKSPMGCYDLLGNVSEWTRTPLDPECPEEDILCSRIVMGSNFTSPATGLTHEQSAEPDTRSPLIGFRCVKEIPISTEQLINYLKQ
ncbi:MAG TPA: protein kinase [Candidatus Hydrogenedens sp.]|nr:protein kinase [Candidatus Hydrogenedens sp.]